MTAKAALAKALLDGHTLNVKNCFKLIGLTNCAREISRMIENPVTGFGVVVFRTHQKGVSKYGQSVTWTDYRLPKIQENLEGILKMKQYILDQSKEDLKYSEIISQPSELQQNLFL